MMSTMKKKLNKLLYREKKQDDWRKSVYFNATTMAAAKEKFIRKSAPDIHSEDLTASQFAYLTGIKHRRHHSMDSHMESESDSDSEDDDDDACYSILTHLSHPHQIWDTEFWQHQSKPTLSKPNVIQKGRFRIVWGQQEDHELTMPTSTPVRCVEWKRKRASST